MISLLTIILQVALEAFIKNPNLAGGSLCGYFPQDTTVSEAPKGYQPFYISHVARHGSRFLSKSSSDCFRVADTLAVYAGKGMLTDEGLALWEDLKMLYGMSDGRFGSLTALGAQEHRDICARMVRHYPEVFSGPVRRQVITWSTISQRVQDSRAAFTDELTSRAPSVKIDEKVPQKSGTNSYALQEVTGIHLTKAERAAAAKEEKSFHKWADLLRKGYDYNVFETRIFKDPAAIPAKTVKYIVRESFKALKTGCVTDPATMPSIGKYFTPRELYALWVGGTLSWARYLNFPGYVNPFTTARGAILECIIRDADEAVTLNSPVAATLRFSHDTYMLPLMASMKLEGTVLSCTEQEIPEYFQDYNFVCPACNVQLIFYRAGKNAPILVKFLRNEKETLIHGLEPATGYYYDWQAVKRFWQKKIL
jgi:hypothetical protein